MSSLNVVNDNPLIFRKNTTFHDALRAIESNGNGYLALIDEHGKLIGILTDGDIRRAILEKKTELIRIVNKKPIVLNINSSKQKVINTLKSIQRRHMPLINEEGLYCGVFTLDAIDFNAKPNKVIVMAGGLGSRLGRLTHSMPKSMLQIGNKPMLEHLISMFSDKGYFDFIFCVNHLKKSIKDYFGDGSTFGVKITYIEEKDRLGTAGALSLLKGLVVDSFFVINADVLTTLDFEKMHLFHEQQKACATMCIRSFRYQVPYGIIKTNRFDHIVSLEEKPTLSFNVNAGIYMLEPKVLDLVPNDVIFDMPQLFEKIIMSDERTAAYEIVDYWIDIGKVEDYYKANEDFNFNRALNKD